MGDNIKFTNLVNVALEIERTEEFVQTANELSNFLRSLPLNNEDNDKLISLMVKQVNTAEKGAFLHGFSMGYGLGDFQEK